MATAVPSRFACLKIEDDDVPPPKSLHADASKTKTKDDKNQASKKSDLKKIKNKPLQQNNNNQQNNQGKKKKKQSQNPDQWEQWKQKDSELVDGHYEDDLHQAILLSKLDYEEKKDDYKQSKKEADKEKKSADQGKAQPQKKQKKNKVMSLEQFNDMVAGNTGEEQKGEEVMNGEQSSPDVNIVNSEGDKAFFDRVVDETKQELLKNKSHEMYKRREPVSDEVISRVQFAEVLEKKNEEIAELKNDVLSLKEELMRVRTRNKKLCSILGQGEMKDKAEVLVEVERLRAVQTELTNEVALLHGQLEQERSKSTAKLDSKSKEKKKKNTVEKEK